MHAQAKDPVCEVGDVFTKLNGTDTSGLGHTEFASMLKELPIGEEFTIEVVKPKRAPDRPVNT